MKKTTVLAIIGIVLLIVTIVLITVAKKKETQTEENAVNNPTATPIPTPTQMPVTVPTETPTEGVTPTSVPTTTPTSEPEYKEDVPEITVAPAELEPLMESLLKDPFGTEGDDPVKSFTETATTELKANLDEYNMFGIDVESKMKELGVAYIPFSVTYVSEAEYLDNGYRMWVYRNAEGDKHYSGGAAIYDFEKGTSHEYTYYSNLGYYSDDGIQKTGITKEEYLPWPSYQLDAIFTEKMPPTMTETEEEYVINGITTTNSMFGKLGKVNYNYRVTTDPSYGFQYLIDITLHYDKSTKHIKSLDAEVVGKVKQQYYGISNDPTAEKVETEIGLTSATLHVEFTKYNSTVLTKLDGKPVVDMSDEKPAEPKYAYKFADGSERYFTKGEWQDAIREFIQLPEGEGGLNDVLKDVESVNSPYAFKLVLLKDIPKEQRGQSYAEDAAWQNRIKDAQDVYETIKSLDRPMTQYYNYAFAGCYLTPVNKYLSSLLIGTDGMLRKELTESGLTGIDYGYMLMKISDTYTDYIRGICEGSIQRMPNLSITEIEEWVWNHDYIRYQEGTTTYDDMGNEVELKLSKSCMDRAWKYIIDDLRSRFEAKFKTWLIKNNKGSATNS